MIDTAFETDHPTYVLPRTAAVQVGTHGDMDVHRIVEVRPRPAGLPFQPPFVLFHTVRRYHTAGPAVPARCMCARDIKHHAKHAQGPWDSS